MIKVERKSDGNVSIQLQGKSLYLAIEIIGILASISTDKEIKDLLLAICKSKKFLNEKGIVKLEKIKPVIDAIKNIDNDEKGEY